MEPSSSSSTSAAPSMEDLTKLLRGKTDSQRLAGLLLVTKFCDKNDQQAILGVYRAVGSTFLRRLLLTGMGKGNSGADSADREAYLKLAVTVLATFARVPEIAAADEILAAIPLFLEFMSTEYDQSVTEECFEFLFLVSKTHDNGVTTLFQSGGVSVLASHMLILPDGSHMMELAMGLVQLIITKQPAEDVYVKHALELSKLVVAAMAKQFAVLQNALKFEALHLLSAILCSTYSGSLHVVLRSMTCKDWSINIRTGVMDVLQNRVVPAEKLQALAVTECVLSIVGEEWLIGLLTLSGAPSSVPVDRCILLVLESSRVEIAVILNDLAYLKYEASKSSPPNAETILMKLRDLGVTFSLIERIIKLISGGENEESSSTSMIAETTLTKIISGINETVGVVLDYLQDAKEHAERKGDDLLACVRLVGSYLAEAPDACKAKVKEILGYMLSIESEDESRPFRSTCFLLPMLCQMTMSDDGCKIFAFTGAFGAVVDCLISLIDASNSSKEDESTVLLACDTVLNVLLKAQEIHLTVDKTSSIKLLKALSRWAEEAREPSVVMMASSICSIILDSTSEAALQRCPDFNNVNLVSLARIMRKSLVGYGQGDGVSSEADLYQIISSGYSSWADKFPHIKEVVEK